MVVRKYIQGRIRSFTRWRTHNAFKLFVTTILLLAGSFAYADYMSNHRLSADPSTYRPLLNLIAQVESSDNYNAYFGNSRNSKITFTDMPIADVMKWQQEYIAKGSPSSAVGRYQIINTTLNDLVNELNIDPEKQRFDQDTQDVMAATLLERRGVQQYVNQELSKEEFAANLAKEWAALPKVIGKNPHASYYADDGLNKSRVKPDAVLKAIEPIEPRKQY